MVQFVAFKTFKF